MANFFINKVLYIKYYLPSFLFFIGSTFVGVFATLVVMYYPNSTILITLIPIIGLFLVISLYFQFEDLRVSQNIKIGELNADKIEDLNIFYSYGRIILIIFSIIMLFGVPIFFLVNKPSHFDDNIQNSTIAYFDNDTIFIRMHSTLRNVENLKILYSDSITKSTEKMTIMDYPILNNYPIYTCKIPRSAISEGIKYFYLIDNKNNIYPTNALQLKHSSLLVPTFAEIEVNKNDLLIKYENPSFVSCSIVKFNCKNLNQDYTITFNRSLLLLDSISVPIRHNDIYRIELIIIDSLNHQIKVDSTFTITNKNETSLILGRVN